MANKPPRSADRLEEQLMVILRASAVSDKPKVLQLLDRFPELAVQKAVIGASRQSARTYILPRISHYVYAGDTALHIAAAAYTTTIARILISKGGNVRA